MPGGLLQISTLSAETLFLNGAPEITFFKTVYRRHTNFAIESLTVNFEDPVEFNNISTAKISQTGDLMHNVYLQVFLPEINLFRNTMPDSTDFQIIYNTTTDNYYNTVLPFMSVNRMAYVDAYNIYIAENNTENATGDMILAINKAFSSTTEIVESMQKLLLSDQNAPFTYNEISMESIAEGFSTESDKNDLFKALSVGIDKSVKTQSYFYYQMYNARIALIDAQNKNIKFAWVKRIGHFIADYIEVRIGGHIIDKHYGIWLNIWYELTANRSIEETYFKMIGNVPELVDFNRTIKPKYILKIPLRFWFCRFSGLAIPLVALEYHNVSFNVKFRSIQEVSYIEAGTNIQYSLAEDGITLDEVPDILGVNIDANLLIDFYYLDSSERKRFAQSSHEYLIEQIQELTTENVSQPNVQFLLNSLVHPTKELIWVAQLTRFTENVSGTNECRWDNYSQTVENKGNNVAYSSLDFNSYNRIMRLDSKYFNYLIPYQNYYSTPSDGINIYSFAIQPLEQQPSGSANLSKISRIIMTLEFAQNLFVNNVINDPLIVRIFSRNINILRIMSGFGAIAYTYLQ